MFSMAGDRQQRLVSLFGPNYVHFLFVFSTSSSLIRNHQRVKFPFKRILSDYGPETCFVGKEAGTKMGNLQHPPASSEPVPILELPDRLKGLKKRERDLATGNNGTPSNTRIHLSWIRMYPARYVGRFQKTNPLEPTDRSECG